MTRPDPVALAQALVRIDTVNPPGLEARCIEPLADLLADAGYDCRTHELAPRRTTLVARIGGRPGATGADAPLCFTGHVDTVPLGAAPWRRDPFGGEIADGRLHGRGSSDMKAGVAAFVAAAVSRADALRDGPGVLLVVTAAEETGCEGAYALVRSAEGRELLGRAGALVVAEPSDNLPLVGHKGALWLSARAGGTTAHGSMPERGDNAIYKIARAALALERHDFGTPPHPLMGAPTLNVGTVRGGLNVNSVPDAAELGVDIRTVPGQDHAALLRCLCGVLGPQIALEPTLDVASVWTEPGDPWMRRVYALHAARTGRPAEPRTVSYFSDAAVLRLPLGMPPVVVLGPGEPALAHQTDESCRVDRIVEAEAIYAALIDDWCGVRA